MRGNPALAHHALAGFVQYPFTFVYYRWRNNSNAKKWEAMTREAQEHYLKTTTDEGNKEVRLERGPASLTESNTDVLARLDFRFAT